MSDTQLTLPLRVATKTDVSRLVSELERVDNELTAHTVRQKVDDTVTDVPVYTPALTEFLHQNDLTLDSSKKRSELIRQLRRLKETLPVIHMTFATPVDQESLQEIVAWLRASIHPQAVVMAGLQPSLVAGVYVRTTNQVHDLSLRRAIQKQRPVLAQQIGALRGN